MNKPTQKDLWKANILEFFHNCLIGISHLECSNPNCPLVLHWGNLERKNSKKGYSALVKLTKDKFLTVDILTYELNGLEEPINLTIQYRDGKEAMVRTKDQITELTKNLTQEEKSQLSFLDPSEIVCFFNNPSHRPNLEGAEEIYLEDLWEIKEDIKWDRNKSRKKVFLHVENDPSDETQAKKIDSANQDYLFYIADPGTTNEIKKMEIYSPQGKEERKQLHEDYTKDFSELRRVFGIRRLTSKKEDRQNNPEIELNEAQFVALEREKWRERMKSIKEAENKTFCLGKHKLTYGAWQERQEAEIEQAQALQTNQETDKLIDLEQRLSQEKEVKHE
ncbi:MAG: hypothetical protein MRECE_19c015 [Mycoplasmataceae bacterium CE_OT135]|nr:MAG: hypothetical protein MRECE_19c015 [Mycoplasmataceae bacterium CE_OT135]